jgi:hypothetical protein
MNIHSHKASRSMGLVTLKVRQKACKNKIYPSLGISAGIDNWAFIQSIYLKHTIFVVFFELELIAL